MKMVGSMKEIFNMDSFQVKDSTKRTLTRIRDSLQMELSMDMESSKTCSDSTNTKDFSKKV